VACARHHVGNEPFAVLLADDLMVDDAKLLKSMLAAHDRNGSSVIAVQEVTPEEISSYGCVEPANDADADGVFTIKRIVEKPSRETAPSNLAVIGRYVFSPGIFDALDRIVPGAGGELQLTDAIALLLSEQPVLGMRCEGGRYDVGQKLDFLRANIELALDREDLGPPLAEWMRDLVHRRGIA
jgi:UTP--glucose-1-phosphate uridylyltransferase